MSEWHYSSNGQQMGPVNSAQLKQLAASGELLATDMVWKDGMADWAPASRIKGLFSKAAVPGPTGGGGNATATTIPVTPAAARPAAVAQQQQQIQDTFPASQQPTSPIGYYNPSAGPSERVARTLKGFPPPSGMQSEWPLNEMQLAQLKDAEKLRKAIRGCGGLMAFFCVVWAFLAVVIGFVGMYGSGTGPGARPPTLVVLIAMYGTSILGGSPSGRAPTWLGGFIMAWAGIFVAFSLLAFLARRATLRCRIWAPITFTTLFGLLLIVNLLSSVKNSGAGPGGIGVPDMIGIGAVLLIDGAFLSVFVKAMLAIPKFLACPLWAQEALVNAKL